MNNIKTSEGTEKYAGKFRLVKNGITPEKFANTEPMDSSALPHSDEIGLVRFETADGQSLYQSISLSELNILQRGYVWKQIAILFMNVELKRKRFYGDHGSLVMEETNATS